MKKAATVRRDAEMLEEYDFSTGVRGKYAERYAAGSNVVILSPDVARVFPDSESANEALRVLAKLIQRRAQSLDPSKGVE